jgi:hypothetical protein
MTVRVTDTLEQKLTSRAMCGGLLQWRVTVCEVPGRLDSIPVTNVHDGAPHEASGAAWRRRRDVLRVARRHRRRMHLEWDISGWCKYHARWHCNIRTTAVQRNSSVATPRHMRRRSRPSAWCGHGPELISSSAAARQSRCAGLSGAWGPAPASRCWLIPGYRCQTVGSRGAGAGDVRRSSLVGGWSDADRCCRARPWPGDQPGASLVAEVPPGPLEQHEQSVPESDQHDDVHRQPNQPGSQSRDVRWAELGDGSGATNRCHGAAIAVPEWSARLSLDRSSDVVRGHRKRGPRALKRSSASVPDADGRV